MGNSPTSSGSQYESEQAWQETRADLLQIHHNVVRILNLRAIHLSGILERADYLDLLNSGVLNVMERGDYGRALENLRDFILENPTWDKMLPEFTDTVEPGLTALSLWGEEYRLSEIL